MNEKEFYEWMVCVKCFTYNQAPYIVDAMNGFTMQQTDFPYVCVIVDDSSPDGEQDVINKYIEDYFDLDDKTIGRKKETDDYHLTFARNKNNANCFFAVLCLKYNHYGNAELRRRKSEYISEWTNNARYYAICEGDDYWIDPRKLQVQVAYLNSHPDFSMCFHGAKIFKESGMYNEDRLHQFDDLETREYFGEELAKKWMIPTASMMYRSSVAPPFDSRFAYGDVVLRNQCSVEGRIFCFSDTMSVYRLNAVGVTSRPISFQKTLFHIEALMDHFPAYKEIYLPKIKKVIISNFKSKLLFSVVWFLIRHPKFISYYLSAKQN